MKKQGQWYPDCKSCQMLSRRVTALLARNRHLQRLYQQEHALRLRAEARLRELQQRQRPNACNSSVPPSASPITAPKPVVKKPTGRKSGAQIGHRGTARRLLPVERMDEVVRHQPEVCQHCQASLQQPAESLRVGRHQVAELPLRALRLIEHQSYACRCAQCGGVTRSRIPEHIQVSCLGERLTAAIGLLAVEAKASRRAVAQVLGEVLGCPISLGSVLARERELSQALHQPYEQLRGQVSAASVKYTDDTGWKRKGRHCSLLVAATKSEAVFGIEPSATHPALVQLLGGKLHGVFCTDRAGIHDRLPLSQRQLCWAHLKRDFVACEERGGISQQVGQAGLEICRALFGLWRQFKHRRLRRPELQQQVEPLKDRLHRVLERGAKSGTQKTAGLCRNLLKREAALWRFAQVPGLEPTNNHAERMLRPAVIWRKKSFGSDSAAGGVYVQRMLSVTQTLRLRGRKVLEYLAAAVGAHRRGLPAPPLMHERYRHARAAAQRQLPRDLRDVA